MKYLMKKFQHELRQDWYDTIQEYADIEGTSVRFLVTRFILAGMNNHTPPNDKGQYMGRAAKKDRNVSERQEADTKRSKPKYDCYDDAITAFCSERGPQPMLSNGREEYEEWNKGLEDFVEEFGYRRRK